MDFKLKQSMSEESRGIFSTSEFLPKLNRLVYCKRWYYIGGRCYTRFAYLFLENDSNTQTYYFRSNDEPGKCYKLSEIISWSYVYKKDEEE